METCVVAGPAREDRQDEGEGFAYATDLAIPKESSGLAVVIEPLDDGYCALSGLGKVTISLEVVADTEVVLFRKGILAIANSL